VHQQLVHTIEWGGRLTAQAWTRSYFAVDWDELDGAIDEAEAKAALLAI
jgi:hypothetical protein